MMRGYEASIPEAERKRVSFYFAEGSHNMDQRGLMSDGEAMLIVSGPQASAGLVDLFYMMARTTWIDRPAELEQAAAAPGVDHPPVCALDSGDVVTRKPEELRDQNTSV